jgi:hypothetical protein
LPDVHLKTLGLSREKEREEETTFDGTSSILSFTNIQELFKKIIYLKIHGW